MFLVDAPSTGYPKARNDYGSGGSEEFTTRTKDSTDRRRQTVVFDRFVTKDYRQHSIDYELSMADEDENDDFRYEGNKRSRAAAIGTNGSPLAAFSLMITVALLHIARL